MSARKSFLQVALQPMITSTGDRKGEVYAFAFTPEYTSRFDDGPLSIAAPLNDTIV